MDYVAQLAVIVLADCVADGKDQLAAIRTRNHLFSRHSGRPMRQPCMCPSRPQPFTTVVAISLFVIPVRKKL